MSIATETTAALRAQFLATPALYYCHDSGFEEADVEQLIQVNKFPFFNILAESWTVMPTDNMNIKDVERREIDILIQFATRALKPLIAKQGDTGHIGLYQFADDLWDAIVSDPTIGGIVDGYTPGSSIQMATTSIEIESERFFIGAAEMRVKFHKDIGRGT